MFALGKAVSTQGHVQGMEICTTEKSQRLMGDEVREIRRYKPNRAMWAMAQISFSMTWEALGGN